MYLSLSNWGWSSSLLLLLLESSNGFISCDSCSTSSPVIVPNHMFPLSRLCTCLSTIDNYGDHLLGCSHCPMRIRRHDALVNIIYNALSQDHPGVLREQRASYGDGLRPSNVFRPDFQHGRPAYFDVSICCTTQPSFISSCASCAGVAAAAGEVAKDEKHLAVEKVGSDFIPLVVETFGLLESFHS